jgi:hypothetical protein
MNLNKYLSDTGNSTHPKALSHIIRERIVCADGFQLSVQASEYHYCTPQEAAGPWTRVEVGFPSAEPELIMPYAEDPDDPINCVYGFVPIELVEQLIGLHGGVQP